MIGKTRQMADDYDASLGPARGLLRLPAAGPAGPIEHTRRAPAGDMTPWIAHYWMVRWDLRACGPMVVETVPHPNVHLVFEAGGATVSGVWTSKFRKVLEGKSQALGVKFQPGGFRPFWKAAVSKLANRTLDAGQIFGPEIADLGAAPTRKSVEAFLRARRPAHDESAVLAARLVEQILQDATLRTVDDLAARVGLGKRSLQRLFSEYVGASPKWVIRRYRLHEAIERLHAGEVDMAALAVELGYYDQAHLSEDLKSIVGVAPGRYQALVTPPPAP